MLDTDGFDARKLQGLKYFKLIDELLERLRPVGTERDRANNRELFFDQYATLMILYYFNPTVTTLRGLQQFSTLEKVQRLCEVRPTSLGSLSEASRVFDPGALEPIIAELAAQAGRSPAAMPAAKEAALAGLIAVDGSLLKALPRMAWALWQDATHRAVQDARGVCRFSRCASAGHTHGGQRSGTGRTSPHGASRRFLRC